MSQFFEATETKKATGALDGMDRAENAGQRVPIIGVLLEGDEFGVKLIEALQAFGQKFSDDFVHCRRVASDGRPGFRTLGAILVELGREC